MAAAILLFCFQGAGRKLSTECRPVAEKVRRLGAKGTKEQGLAGVCAPSRRRPSAEKVRRLGAKGTKEQGFAGIRAPSPCRPSAEKVRRLGAKGTKEQGFAGICAPSRRRPSAEKVWRLGAKGTKEQGFAGDRAPSRRRPSAEKIGKGSRSLAELAPHCRQSLVPPLRGANILPWSAAGNRPSWRPIAGKALCLRYEAPTFCPGALPVTGRVGASVPAKPYAFVTGRQHFTLRIGRAPAELAPHCRQSHVYPLRGANISP